MARLYTELFVNAPSDLGTLVSKVASAVSGTVDLDTVTGMACEMDVRKSDDYSPEMLARDPSDFIYFPYTVEIEPVRSDLDLERYLAVVGSVMESLARTGMQVVAACDWENRLPGRGRLGL